MKRFTKYIFLIAGLFLMFGVSAEAREFTEEQVAEMIANAPGPEMFPQAGSYILLDQKVVTIADDMSAVTDEYLVVKILQDRGKNSYADIKRRYDKDSDSIVVVKAVTHLADGSVLEVEDKAINDITPAVLANATIYSNIMQKVISFPGIAPGVSIELKLRKYSKAPETEEELHIWGTEMFQGNEPIAYKELSITAPTAFPIKYTVQNESLDFATSEGDGNVTYSWRNENALQIIPEPFMPNFVKIVPRLIFTSANDWNTVGSWFAGKFYQHVKTDGDVAKTAKKLTKGLKTDKEKIEAISLYVINDIRDVGEGSLPLGIAGYEPHGADVVLKNKYGDWRDKSVLLVSLLKSAGYDCAPVFIHRSEPKTALDYPSLKQFNAIYVYVDDFGGEPLWVNPFADHCPFGYFPAGQGTKAFLVHENTFELIDAPEYPAERNRSSAKFELAFEENGDAKGNLVCELEGYFDFRARSRLKDATPKKVEQYFDAAINTVGEGSRSVDFRTSDFDNLTEGVKIAQNFETPELGILQGDMMIIYAPAIPFDFAVPPVASGEAMRFYDFEVDSDLWARSEGTISLPKGFKAVYIPDEYTIENEMGAWTTRYTVSDDGSSVDFVNEIKILDTTIDPDEYLSFKQYYDEYVKPKNNMILLERN